jgi:hypothetical protein
LLILHSCAVSRGKTNAGQNAGEADDDVSAVGFELYGLRGFGSSELCEQVYEGIRREGEKGVQGFRRRRRRRSRRF